MIEELTTIVARATMYGPATMYAVIAELREIGHADPDPTTGGALLRIADAIQGAAELPDDE